MIIDFLTPREGRCLISCVVFQLFLSLLTGNLLLMSLRFKDRFTARKQSTKLTGVLPKIQISRAAFLMALQPRISSDCSEKLTGSTF